MMLQNHSLYSFAITSSSKASGEAWQVLVEFRHYFRTMNTTNFSPSTPKIALHQMVTLTNSLYFTGSLSKGPSGYFTTRYKSIIKVSFLAMEKGACENSHQTSDRPTTYMSFPEVMGRCGERLKSQAYHIKTNS